MRRNECCSGKKEIDLPPNMYYYSKKIIQSVSIFELVHGVKQPQFERKRNTISQLDVLLYVLLELEALEVQSKNVWKFPDLHTTGD